MGYLATAERARAEANKNPVRYNQVLDVVKDLHLTIDFGRGLTTAEVAAIIKKRDPTIGDLYPQEVVFLQEVDLAMKYAGYQGRLYGGTEPLLFVNTLWW